MVTPHITTHAVQRYQERVANVADDEVRSIILAHSEAIEKAARFRAPCVLLASGVRLILEGSNVVTVLAKGMHQTRGER